MESNINIKFIHISKLYVLLFINLSISLKTKEISYKAIFKISHTLQYFPFAHKWAFGTIL